MGKEKVGDSGRDAEDFRRDASTRPSLDAPLPGNGIAGAHGVVLNGTGGVWQVQLEDGTVLDAALRGRLKIEKSDALKLAVGDNVIVERDARGSAWAITEVLPRRSQLARRAPGGGPGMRVVAANLDQVIVVFAAASPEPHLRMLDRFLVISEGNDLRSRIVVNKVDLVDSAQAQEQFRDYAAAGYPVHYTSVKAGIGLAELSKVLERNVSVLSGPSGVGKSSLLNTLFPGLNLRVGEISQSVNKGRHTTVGASMHPLPSADGGYVVDTPGLREVGTWGVPAESLDYCFPEFRPLLDECRFGDCTHDREPGCAVRAAVADHSVSRERYDSYCKLLAEMQAADSQRFK